MHRATVGGAGVVIASHPPPSSGGFYPAPRYVVTEHALELSWLFESLWRSFSGVLDYATKFEFFGRLANRANAYLSHAHDARLDDLLFAVLHEAFLIREDIESGVFHTIIITSGNRIVDDLGGNRKADGYPDADETRRFFDTLLQRTP
jgi:hypothetical protein